MGSWNEEARENLRQLEGGSDQGGGMWETEGRDEASKKFQRQEERIRNSSLQGEREVGTEYDLRESFICLHCTRGRERHHKDRVLPSGSSQPGEGGRHATRN